MDSEDARIRMQSLLRRFGLAGVSRPILIGMAILAVALLLLALWRFWPFASAQSDDFSVQTAASATTEEAEQDDSGQQATAAQAYVDVEGEVRKPGVYAVAADARIDDAVKAAGGFTKKAQRSGVNLAQKVTDGMQIVVPSASSDASGSGTSGTATGTSATATGKINLNTASAEELQTLSGIGPSLSQRIVDYRTSNGGFKSIEELKEVSGIGDARYESLKDLVCV